MPEQLPQLGGLCVGRQPAHVHDAAPVTRNTMQVTVGYSNTLRPFIIWTAVARLRLLL
jgi:hypothetical protein